MNKILLVSGCLLSLNLSAQIIVKDTLFFTGDMQTWTLPCGASNVFVDAFGAQGAAGSTFNPDINSGGAAGLGNQVSGSLSFLEPGDELYVYVGGKANGSQGGFNGGGNGASGNSIGGYPSGGGGGATDIRFPSTSLQDRIMVAGGGGGGGNAGLHGDGTAFTGGFGGNGGGQQGSLNGSNGTATQDTEYSAISPGAMGGTETEAGAAGIGCPSFLGQNGQQGSTGQGGNGGLGNAGFGQAQSIMAPHGGGGGGGYIGGNGGGGGSAGNANCFGNVFGAGGGGSAGTNYFDGPVAGQIGVNVNNGFVVFTYTLEEYSVTIDENFNIPCVGEEAVIFATPENGTWTTITGDNAINDGVFAPTTEGNYTMVYSKEFCGNIYTDTITVEVNCTLGLFENQEISVNFYPNPVITTFSIENAIQSTVEIHDLTGKVVMKTENYDGNDINISNFSNGIYTISVKNKGFVSSSKLIKH